MKIAVVGSGYVGLVAGACFADMGNHVICIDKDPKKIEKLENGTIPIYEPGLDNLVTKSVKENRLTFTTNLPEGIKDVDFIFIAVGTPPNEDGSADLKHVIAVAREIGQNINEYKIIIDKSTVPVGTADKVKEAVSEELQKRNVNIDFDVVSNPEFLKEGNAISDFMKPDRVIVGTDSNRAKVMMEELYSAFTRQNNRVIFMDVRSAEVTKYAANSILATKISFMNEMSNLCDKVGADIENVRIGIGADRRIGYSFIYPGIGYGGSCFPKDVKAIIKTAKDYGYQMKILEAVEEVNNAQKSVLFEKIKQYFELRDENLKGKTIAVWGLSFKPETDDMREAPSKIIIKSLLEAGAKVKVTDPEAMEEAKTAFKGYEDKIEYLDDCYDTLNGSDALAVLTEWHIYRQPDYTRIKESLNFPVIFDGRNMYNPVYVRSIGVEYFGIGRK